jgi:hypothetical protein
MNMHNRLVAHNWRGNVDMQIILDQHACIAYMVKYTTKAEKAGSSLLDLYKTVINNAKEDDNPVTKLRSLMLQSVSGKRDIGQCEVCRLLSSEPLYSSTFEYVKYSLELNQSRVLKQLNKPDLPDANVTIKSLLDHFAERSSNNLIANVNNFHEFLKKYKIAKGELVLRRNSDKIIVVTYPKVHYNPNIKEKYTEYCFYQMIKFSPWTKNDMVDLQNKETAIVRWEAFFNTASDELKNSIK